MLKRYIKKREWIVDETRAEKEREKSERRIERECV